MIGTFSQGILGDIYNRQIYIGLEEYETKLLTRREIVALITNVETNLEEELGELVQNASALNYLASISSKIIESINTSYSLVENENKTGAVLNKIVNDTTTPSGTITYPVYKLSYDDKTHIVNFEQNGTSTCSFTTQTIAIFDLVKA